MERQRGRLLEKQEGRRCYPLLHQVFSPRENRSLEHSIRYSLSAKLNWGIKSPLSQRRESSTNSVPSKGWLKQQRTALVTTTPMESGRGTAAYGRWGRCLPGCMYTKQTMQHTPTQGRWWGFILLNNLSQEHLPAPGACGTVHYTSTVKLFPPFLTPAPKQSSVVHSAYQKHLPAYINPKNCIWELLVITTGHRDKTCNKDLTSD